MTMSADPLLARVLQAYRGPTNPEEKARILSTTTSLLTTLSNPLNIALLTSQLLTAPAIWNLPEGLRTSVTIISVFHTAARTVHEHSLARLGTQKKSTAFLGHSGSGLTSDEWTRAVIKGLDDRSARWQHLLVIAGLLLGMVEQGEKGVSAGLKADLERAVITAVNRTLESLGRDDMLNSDSVVLALAHVFPLLSPASKHGLGYDALGPIMIRHMISSEGYDNADFMRTIDLDVKSVAGNKYHWPARSPSLLQVRNLGSKPLILAMGPCSNVLAHAIGKMRDSSIVVDIQEKLLAFTGEMLRYWFATRLSEVDYSQEELCLSSETLRVTFPLLWQTLKNAMFATIVILQAISGRTLIDRALSVGHSAPAIAVKTLRILRNVYFISSRLGANAFSAYTYVNLASIDILYPHPTESIEFLQSICPEQAGQIPVHSLLRNLDLFYLNTCEHFTRLLPPLLAMSLVGRPAEPYLKPSSVSFHNLELFEASHSAYLSLLASPQAAALTADLLPPYINNLFLSFPTYLSPSQFIYAFQTLLRIATPPSPVSANDPEIAETLLEVLHHNAIHASPIPLPLKRPHSSNDSTQPSLSAQSHYLLTLLSCLSLLPSNMLEEWLDTSSTILNAIPDATMREHCKERFWEALVSGEMDSERARICVAWWDGKRGRDSVLFGKDRKARGQGHEVWMSGALGGVAGKESRL